jgi:hypothetical protein
VVFGCGDDVVEEVCNGLSVRKERLGERWEGKLYVRLERWLVVMVMVRHGMDYLVLEMGGGRRNRGVIIQEAVFLALAMSPKTVQRFQDG